MTRAGLLAALGLPLLAQAPLLQDAALALQRDARAWVLGEEPFGPSSLPFLEVGLGGAGSEGAWTPLLDGEGLGTATRGAGLGLQGRVSKGGWSLAATALAFRNGRTTVGVLQRGAAAFASESGWRVALEQTPLAWGNGLTGDELLSSAARAFPRGSLATPTWALGATRLGLEVFLGRLETRRPIPTWLPDGAAREAARAAGLDLDRRTLAGARGRAALGTRLGVQLGVVRFLAPGEPATVPAPRTASLVDLRLRLPELAAWLGARGAALQVSRSAAPDGLDETLAPARTRVGLQVVGDRWDSALEVAQAATSPPRTDWSRPADLAGASTRGDALGPALPRSWATRAGALGFPLPAEGQGRLRLVHATSPMGSTSWLLQGEAQWRTGMGKAGASVATRRDDLGPQARWGWTFAVFQSFRVF